MDSDEFFPQSDVEACAADEQLQRRMRREWGPKTPSPEEFDAEGLAGNDPADVEWIYFTSPERT